MTMTSKTNKYNRVTRGKSEPGCRSRSWNSDRMDLWILPSTLPVHCTDLTFIILERAVLALTLRLLYQQITENVSTDSILDLLKETKGSWGPHPQGTWIHMDFTEEEQLLLALFCKSIFVLELKFNLLSAKLPRHLFVITTVTSFLLMVALREAEDSHLKSMSTSFVFVTFSCMNATSHQSTKSRGAGSLSLARRRTTIGVKEWWQDTPLRRPRRWWHIQTTGHPLLSEFSQLINQD